MGQPIGNGNFTKKSHNPDRPERRLQGNRKVPKFQSGSRPTKIQVTGYPTQKISLIERRGYNEDLKDKQIRPTEKSQRLNRPRDVHFSYMYEKISRQSQSSDRPRRSGNSRYPQIRVTDYSNSGNRVGYPCNLENQRRPRRLTVVYHLFFFNYKKQCGTTIGLRITA